MADIGDNWSIAIEKNRVASTEDLGTRWGLLCSMCHSRARRYLYVSEDEKQTNKNG